MPPTASERVRPTAARRRRSITGAYHGLMRRRRAWKREVNVSEAFGIYARQLNTVLLLACGETREVPVEVSAVVLVIVIVVSRNPPPR